MLPFVSDRYYNYNISLIRKDKDNAMIEYNVDSYSEYEDIFCRPENIKTFSIEVGEDFYKINKISNSDELVKFLERKISREENKFRDVMIKSIDCSFQFNRATYVVRYFALDTTKMLLEEG